VTELIGFEETTRQRRTNGAPLRYEPGRPDWRTERDRQKAELGVTQQPYCVIVGAGQAGLGLGARLKQLGVPTLIIDKRERPSDTWRERYATLSLHSPVWYDHMPYLPFPETWPRFASKDRVADWLDAYATIMDLDTWSGTDCVGSRYDKALGAWRLSIVRGGRPIELRPAQLVLATGFWDAPYVPDIPGRDRFGGRQLHVAEARELGQCGGLRSIVIGAGTSAHDIAAQLWEAGANVTMIQRSPTIVTRIDTLLPAVEIYDTAAAAPKPPTELADLLAASIPNRLMPQFQAPFIAAMVLVMFGSRATIAQTVGSATSSAHSASATVPLLLTQNTRLIGAPVGHRQPHAVTFHRRTPPISSISAKDAAVDRKLNICRGC
jgi:putative flavoprotein involved in K+ transport